MSDKRAFFEQQIKEQQPVRPDGLFSLLGEVGTHLGGLFLFLESETDQEDLEKHWPHWWWAHGTRWEVQGQARPWVGCLLPSPPSLVSRCDRSLPPPQLQASASPQEHLRPALSSVSGLPLSWLGLVVNE